VGAVIVAPDGRIIGEGFHRKCGGPHAEVNAIASVRNKDMLEVSTIYVTLEPCAHIGRTGPCARLLIEKKIPDVVVGCRDPFEQVNGRGIDMLLEAGVNVKVGVLEKECMNLNAVFFTAHTFKRPFVTLKWAQTADGFLDSVRTSTHESPLRISTSLTSTLMHRQRAINDGIFIGSNTVFSDNPMLDTRLWPGKSPKPIVADVRGRLSSSFNIMQRDPLIIRRRMSIEDLLHKLYQQNITSILVEGGAETLTGFLESGLWDLARVEIARWTLGDRGHVKAPEAFSQEPDKMVEIGSNIVKYYINNPLVDVKNL
ncbi:MAG: bifunctional diaminohydroxyphosphoribosylaminopyrimidine deaminase/5-amino-6-(5-phosphoribosylamino)uracil reductase RibD, partial [Muribaculaceae bacterium]|nr:bifunctional diaminohydroxyphosphoribosylaminopyrimidine deaminase/5-amino-6-(5-phosphoribosylamino)uracil reductase RibD [Muribaculaceae bacterium]